MAGGGSFFSFPALLFAGHDAKVANATNTVALWPGSAAGAAAYRNELKTQRSAIKLLAAVSLVGGLVGALLLLITPSSIFSLILPYLMLGATSLFALSPRINQFVRRASAQQSGAGHHMQESSSTRWRSIFLQGIISIYGGFFGGGIGILMLATLSLMGIDDIHEMNALKTVLATLINGIAVVTFAVAKQVAWPAALLMAVGAILGGYGGAALARRVPAQYVRTFVVVVGFILSAYLFVR